FQILEKEIVRSDASGRLVRAKTLVGVSKHPNGTYERKAPIEWKAPVDDYIFCSKVRPAVIVKWEDHWNADLLSPGSPEGVFGYNTSSYVQYFFVCHGLSDADPNDASLGQKF